MPRPRSGRPWASTAIHVKGTPEWGAWVERLAGHTGRNVSIMVERALLAEARRAKFPEPPPPRVAEP
jgi:hypothetical protein